MRTDRYQVIGKKKESSWGTIAMAVVVFGVIGLVVYLVTKPDKQELKILAPLYVFPHSAFQTIDPRWLTLEKSAIDNPDVEQVVVINPANGAGALWDATVNDYTLWKTVTDKLKVLKNVKLVGYVPTGYGDASKVALAKSYIDGYFANWPIEGIFFDETGNQPSANNTAIYKDYVAYTETKLKGSFGRIQLRKHCRPKQCRVQRRLAGTCRAQRHVRKRIQQTSLFRTLSISKESRPI